MGNNKGSLNFLYVLSILVGVYVLFIASNVWGAGTGILMIIVGIIELLSMRHK